MIRSGTRRNDAPSGRWQHAGLLGAVFVATILFQCFFFDRWLGLLDEGYVLAIADDIRQGQVPYRDVIIDAPLPAAFYLLAWWFELVGVSVRSSRWLAVFGFAIFVTAIVRLARLVLPVRETLGLFALLLAYRVFAFPHWQVYSYSLVAATFAALAMVAVAAAVDQGARRRLFVAGLLVGGAIAAKQDYGAGMTAAVGLLILVLRWPPESHPQTLRTRLAPTAVFTLGIAVVLLPMLAWFAARGALTDMVEQTVRFPLTAISRAQYPSLPSLWPLFAQDPTIRARIGEYLPSIIGTLWWGACPGCTVEHLSLGRLWRETAMWDLGLKAVFWIPLLLYPVGVVTWLARARRERARGITVATTHRLIVLAFAGGFLLAFSKPHDWAHLMMVYPPQLLFGAYLAYDGAKRLPARVACAGGVVLALATTLLLVVSLALVVDLRHAIAYPLAGARGGVFADPSNGPVVTDVLAWIDAHVPAEAPLLVLPAHPMVAFLAARPTPWGYHVIWPFQGAARDRRIIAALDAHPAPYALYSPYQWRHLGRFQDNAPLLFETLVTRYEIARVFSRDRFGPIMLGLRRRAVEPDAVALRALAPTLDGGIWETWPFDVVLTQPAGPPSAPSVIRVPVVIPVDHPILRLAIGVNPDHWLDAQAGPITWTIDLEEDGPPRSLLHTSLDPRGRVEDRGWHPIDLDLAATAGRRIVLAFALASGEPLASGVAGWRAPVFLPTSARVKAHRIATRSGGWYASDVGDGRESPLDARSTPAPAGVSR